jgi:hypothetical protein
MEDGCTSIVDHLDCQSNHKYLDASLLKESKNGISKNKRLLAALTLENIEKLFNINLL